jgi:putative hydrolase of the HAD superfamily
MIESMNIRTVVFDCDGVMVAPWRFAAYLSAHHGLMGDRTRPFFDGPFVRCLIGQADIRETVGPFISAWGLPYSVDEFLDLWLEIENAAIPETVDYVTRLRRMEIHCVLATNQESRRAAYVRDTMGFGALFDQSFFSCDLGVRKPDLAFFEEVGSHIDAEPSEILFWDDSASCVEAARHLGWRAEVFQSVDGFVDVMATAVART